VFATSTVGNTGSLGQGQSVPISSRSDVQNSHPTKTAFSKFLNLNDGQKELLEQTLGKYIGPLSKTLIRKEASRQTTTNGFLQALAVHIDRPDDRAHFLQSMSGKL
jgi:hypothetical protein